MTFRLLALDMDGTLLNRQREISQENVKWIRAAMESGVKVTLATGRPIQEAAPYAEQLELDSPLVINNGSEVWKSTNVLHSRHELDAKFIVRIFEQLKPYGDDVSFWAHTTQGKIDKTNLPEDPHQVGWLQFAVRCTNPELLKSIYEELHAWHVFEISNSHVTNIECNASGISKASGLHQVCELLGMKLSEVIAIGDSLNDIPMIRAAGLGVAMGNAQEKVKQAADIIAPANHEDGVAQIIQRYICK